MTKLLVVVFVIGWQSIALGQVEANGELAVPEEQVPAEPVSVQQGSQTDGEEDASTGIKYKNNGDMNGDFDEDLAEVDGQVHSAPANVGQVDQLEEKSKKPNIILHKEIYRSKGTVKYEGNFMDGKRNGTFIFYDPEGNPYSREFKNNKMRDASGEPFNGVDRNFYPNGKISIEKNYKNGDRHGPVKIYSSDGVLLKEANYQKGKLHGIKKVYYPDGKLKSKATYFKGRMDGISKYYDEAGNLIQGVKDNDSQDN